MRVAVIVAAVVLAAIGIGAAIEASNQPKTYSLDGHAFTAAFPGTPFPPAPATSRLSMLEYFRVVSPPRYSVAFVALGLPVFASQTRRPPQDDR